MEHVSPQLAAARPHHPNLSRDELIARLRALEPAFRAEGVTRLALFGSRARGDNRPDSDVDVLIDVDPARKFSLLDLVGVGHIIEDELSLDVHVTEKLGAKPRFLEKVAKDIVEVFG